MNLGFADEQSLFISRDRGDEQNAGCCWLPAVVESRKSWTAGLVCSLFVAAGMTVLAQNPAGPGPATRLTFQYSGATAIVGAKASTGVTRSPAIGFVKVLPPSDHMRLTLPYSGATVTAGTKGSAGVTRSPATGFVKALPPSDQLPEGKGPFCGFWYELQDTKGVVKYRRITGNPILPPGSTTPILGEKVFSVTIPTPAEGDQLVIFSSPLVPGGELQPAEIIARFVFTLDFKEEFHENSVE